MEALINALIDLLVVFLPIPFLLIFSALVAALFCKYIEFVRSCIHRARRRKLLKRMSSCGLYEDNAADKEKK